MSVKDRVREAGVVGAGGAGFPTHVKLAARVDTVVANGAECEPVLVTDQWVSACRPGDVVDALRAVGGEVGASRLVLAVKRRYGALIGRLRPFLGRDVELFELDDFYPAGDEQVLVHEVTGRVVPEGGIPLEVGCVVQNVSTLLNIRDAIEGRPVIEKHVTVAGEVARPGVFVAPIGTAASEVLASAGGVTVPAFRVIEGGPMMGSLLADIDSPVTKTTAGYIVLPADHPVVTRKSMQRAHEVRRASSACCECRMCTDMCPRYLLGHRIYPHLAMRSVHAATDDIPQVHGTAFLCSQCGVCEAYSCSMGLSARRVIQALRERLVAAGVKNPCRDRPPAREAQAWARVPKPRMTERLGLGHVHLPATGTPQPVNPPWEVRIPLKQHTGAPAVAVVRRGDRVKAGGLVGEIPEGALGARVHASMDGVVTDADAHAVRIARRA